MKISSRTLFDAALIVLALVGIVMFVRPIPPKQVDGTNWGRAPVVERDGKRVACALPATYEELSKAFVCVCPNAGKVPIGSGVLLGYGRGEGFKVYLVTARHVAATCVAEGGENSVSFILHRARAENDYRKTFSGSAVKWAAGAYGADLAMVEVAQAFQTSRREGVDVKYIPIRSMPTAVDDDAVVQGAFLIRRGDFGRFGIGLGCEIGVLGFAGELWSAMQGRDRQPMAYRAGHLAVRNDELKTFTPGGAPTYIIESNLHPGFSGGPVFAHYQVNGLTYPALIGIVQDVVASRGAVEVVAEQNGKTEKLFMPSGYAAVAPIDDLLIGK